VGWGGVGDGEVDEDGARRDEEGREQNEEERGERTF
jgi:hypothetical protein